MKFLILPVAAAMLLTGIGCTTRKASASDGPLPLVTVSPGAVPDQHLEDIIVQVTNTTFEHDIYETQPGDVSLVLRTHGGPYLFSIDQLVDRRELPANADRRILVNVSTPGRYTMGVAEHSGGCNHSEATATLDVRAAGDR